MLVKALVSLAVLLPSFAAFSEQELRLTTAIPVCKVVAAKPLPPAYYVVAAREPGFKWVKHALKSDAYVGGPGWPRVDGTDLDNYFSFFRVDLNNDGVCDWFLDSSASLSSGGDRDSINVLYIGEGTNWKRIGVRPRKDNIDILDGDTPWEEKLKFMFGEDIATLHDDQTNINYFITAFYSRHEEQFKFLGYRIFVWDKSHQSLRLLDKWKVGSEGYQVYAYFKAHGATQATNSGDGRELAVFDPDIESQEIEQACEDVMLGASTVPAQESIPAALLAKCKQ